MMNRFIAKLIFFFIFSASLFQTANAESFKNLILTNCEKAKEEFYKLPEEEKIKLFDFFKRVLELKSTPLPDDPSGRENYILPIQPSSVSPFSKPVGEDYFRSISPTRDVDAKLCVLKIANSRERDALQLIPGFFDLESSALLSEESRFNLRRSILEIANANSDRIKEVNEVLGAVASRANSKNSWLLSALVVEFGQSANPVITDLVLDKDEIKFKSAINALELFGHNQDFIADLLELHSSKLSPKRIENLVYLASETNLTSRKLFKVTISKLTQPTEPLKAPLLSLLKTSAESVLEPIGKDPQLEAYLSSILINLPLSEISHLTEMTCTSGRCDKILRTIVKAPTLISGIEGKVLSLISLAENFDPELWKFAEDNWKTQSSPDRILALRAVASFPGKKEQALGYLNQAVKELASGKKLQLDRSELVRSVAFAMVKLSPIPSATIPQSIGEEILGLSSDSVHLPALAISSIKPSPISLLIKAVHSKSESTVDEALIAVEKSHPLDANLFVALLGLAGEASPAGETATESITADKVLLSYEDSALPILEQLAKGKDDSIARKASIRLLSRRSNNKTAKDLLVKSFSKLSCGAKFEVVFLLKEEKLFKAEQLKHCFTELAGSSYLKNQLPNVRLGLSKDDWKAVSTQLPWPIVYSECANGNLLLAEDSIAGKLNAAKEDSSSLETQVISAQCGSRISELIQPEVKEKFVKLLDEQLNSNASLDLKVLAAAIRFGSHTEAIEKKFGETLKEKNLSSALGELLVGSKLIESHLTESDDLLLPGASHLICSSQLKSAELEKQILALIPKEKDDVMLPLVQALGCLNPESTELKEQLFKLALTPVFEENKDIKLVPSLLKIINDTKWNLNYLESKFKKLSLN